MELSNSICVLDHVGNHTLCEYLNIHCDSHYFFAAKAYYCTNKSPSPSLALSYSIEILIVIAIVVMLLGLVVSNYLLYCVTNFTELLGINNKVLSFFIIPLTNSLPDLFNYHVAMNSDSVDLALGQVIGANLITFTIVIGLICIFCPFSVQENRGIIIGMAWALGMILILGFVLSDSKINIMECLLMCVLFFCYAWSLHHFDTRDDCGFMEVESVVSHKSNNADETTSLLPEHRDSLIEDRENFQVRKSFPQRILDGLADVFDHLIFVFIPISKCTFRKLKRNEHKLKSTLFESHFFHLWMVIVSCVLLNFNTLQLSVQWVICGAIIIYLICELARRHANETSCNVLVDVASTCNSLGIISLLTKVVVQLIKNLGVIWRVSEYTMGLLVFSIVNSITDIAMNVLLSTNLGPALGVNSCLGTCLLLILFGIGLNGLFKLLANGASDKTLFDEALYFTLSPEIYLSSAALFIIVLTYILYLPLNRWQLDRRIGVFGICAWITTTIACLVLDFHSNA